MAAGQSILCASWQSSLCARQSRLSCWLGTLSPSRMPLANSKQPPECGAGRSSEWPSFSTTPPHNLFPSATSAVVAARVKRSLSLLRAGQHRLETKSAHLPDRTLRSGIPRSINLQRTCEILPELGVKDLPLLPKPSSQTRQDQPTSTSMSLRLQPRHLTRNPRHITRNPRPFW